MGPCERIWVSRSRGGEGCALQGARALAEGSESSAGASAVRGEGFHKETRAQRRGEGSESGGFRPGALLRVWDLRGDWES